MPSGLVAATSLNWEVIFCGSQPDACHTGLGTHAPGEPEDHIAPLTECPHSLGGRAERISAPASVTNTLSSTRTPPTSSRYTAGSTEVTIPAVSVWVDDG